MYQLIMFIHVFAAVCIVALVLVQQGKGATLGAGFGSGASQTIFGSRGSGSFLFRLTISFIAIFFATSIALNYIAVHAYKEERALNLPAMPVPVRTHSEQLPTQPQSKQVPAQNRTESPVPNEIPTRK